MVVVIVVAGHVFSVGVFCESTTTATASVYFYYYLFIYRDWHEQGGSKASVQIWQGNQHKLISWPNMQIIFCHGVLYKSGKFIYRFGCSWEISTKREFILVLAISSLPGHFPWQGCVVPCSRGQCMFG